MKDFCLFVCLWCLIFPDVYSWTHVTLTAMMFTHSYCCCHYLFPLLINGPQMPAPLMQASLFRLKWPVPPSQVPAQVDSSQCCHRNGTWFCWLYLLFPCSVILLWMTLTPRVFLLLPVIIYLSCFLYCMSATFCHVYSIKSTSPVCS